MDRVPAFQRDLYEGAFRLADEGYYNGRVDSTTKNREAHWKNWWSFVEPLGVDPSLQDTAFRHQVRALTGFAALQRVCYYGQGKQVQAATVSGAITAIGQKIALEHQINPTKMPALDKLLPRISELLAGWAKMDPPTQKKLPVEADVPEFLSQVGGNCNTHPLTQAV